MATPPRTPHGFSGVSIGIDAPCAAPHNVCGESGRLGPRQKREPRPEQGRHFHGGASHGSAFLQRRRRKRRRDTTLRGNDELMDFRPPRRDIWNHAYNADFA